MKALIAAVVLAALFASPAMAASPVACKDPKADLIAYLDRNHVRVPDLVARQYVDPKVVAVGAKYINDQPPATHFEADAIAVMGSASRGYGFAILVDHGCILASMQLSILELEQFVHLITDPGNPA